MLVLLAVMLPVADDSVAAAGRTNTASTQTALWQLPAGTLPMVTVYLPVSDSNPVGGMQPTHPTVDTAVVVHVNPLKTRAALINTTKLPVEVTLSTWTNPTIFPPVTLHVDGTAADGKPYHHDVPVTTSPVQLPGNQQKEYKVVMAVPPESGRYTVVAGTDDPRMSIGSINTLFVDYGGYYRIGVIHPNLHKEHGGVGVTIMKVDMTHTATHVYFTLTGPPGVRHAPTYDGGTVLQQVVPYGGTPRTIDSAIYGLTAGPATKGAKSPTQLLDWFADPTHSSATALHFTLDAWVVSFANNQARLVETEHFQFVIPLGTTP